MSWGRQCWSKETIVPALSRLHCGRLPGVGCVCVCVGGGGVHSPDWLSHTLHTEHQPPSNLYKRCTTH